MSAPGQNNVDIDALLDLSEYDGMPNYQSPALSPVGTSKSTFASPVSAVVAAPTLTTNAQQTLSGPSHNYEMYRQQTGFVPGAIANTMAVNQTNNTGYQDFGNMEYISTFSPEHEVFDFNTSPAQGMMNGTDVDMEFESPSDSQPFFSTVNPSNIEQEGTAAPPQTGNVGRLWPGAHSQAALAKAQAQAQAQSQQRQLMQQQQVHRQSTQPKSRGKAPQPADPLVEQKITQLLNSMRARPANSEGPDDMSPGNITRSKKEEEEMDEDERLLASEEGKKLSSKERRQLRNKVSARAFRSRRKEYISQLEAEIATKVNENGDLRAQNRALVEENKRLTDLTRMLLSSSSFSSFLDTLSNNPAASAQPVPVKVESPTQAQSQAQPQQELRKDTNPYGPQHSQQQQIGMAMIPEQNMDFSMLTLDGSYNFQPQVFIVDTPEIPTSIDASVLSGKICDMIDPTVEFDDEKVDSPTIEYPAEQQSSSAACDSPPLDEDFENDPAFALYHSDTAPTSAESTRESDAVEPSYVDIFGGIEPEKIFARYDFVDATEEEASAAAAMGRVQRISQHISPLVARLEILTRDL